MKTQNAIQIQTAAGIQTPAAELAAGIQNNERQAKRANTQTAYLSDAIQFQNFATANGAAIKEYSQAAGVSLELAAVLAWADELKKAGYKTASIKRKVYAVKTAYNFTAAENGTIKNTLAGIANQIGTEQHQAAQLNYNAVLSVVLNLKTSGRVQDKRNGLLLFLAFVSGFRGSELVSLHESAVKVDAKTISFTASADDTKQHNTQCRAFSLSNFNGQLLAELYAAYMAAKDSEPAANRKYLFCGCQYNKLTGNQLNRVDFCRLVKKTFGQEFSAHSTRRGLVAFASDNKFSDSQIANFMGYKSAEMIKRYNVRNNALQNSLFQ